MATGATEFIDVTTADFYLEEKWSQQSTIAREENLIFAKHFDRKFEAELRRGQKLWIGEISNLAARAKNTNAAITYETVTETGTSLTVSTFYYAAIALEDVIKPQVSVALLDKYVPKLSYALTLQEDTDIAGHPDDFTNTVGTLATGLSYDNLIRADQYLNDANVPQEGRFIGIAPAEKANLLKMEQFINNDYAKLTGKGIFGSWMGYPIYVSTNVEGTNAAGHDNFMAHKDAVAIIDQIKPMVKSFWDIDYFCVKMASLTTYTSGIIRNDHGVWMKGA